MKKLLVLLLALTMVGAAFAQDAPALKFSGYLDTGVAVITGQDFDADGDYDDTVFKLDGDDSGTAGRFNLNGSFTNENVGVSFRMRVSGDLDAGTPVIFMKRVYAWGTMFDGLLKAVAGKLGDYTWSTAGNDFGHIDGGLAGVQLQVMPMEGLNFGFFVPATTGGALAEDAFSDILIGAAYDMEGLGGFRAGVDLSPVDESTFAWFGAEITAVENFVFYLDYAGTDLGNDVSGSHYLWWEVDYTMDALNVGIDLEQEFWTFDEAPIGLSFGPYVAYTLDMVTLGAGFTYYMTTETDLVDSTSGIYIHPYAKYNVGPSANIELGAKINTGDIEDLETPLTEDTTKVYLNFTWEF